MARFFRFSIILVAIAFVAMVITDHLAIYYAHVFDANRTWSLQLSIVTVAAMIAIIAWVLYEIWPLPKRVGPRYIKTAASGSAFKLHSLDNGFNAPGYTPPRVPYDIERERT